MRIVRLDQKGCDIIRQSKNSYAERHEGDAAPGCNLCQTVKDYQEAPEEGTYTIIWCEEHGYISDRFAELNCTEDCTFLLVPIPLHLGKALKTPGFVRDHEMQNLIKIADQKVSLMKFVHEKNKDDELLEVARELGIDLSRDPPDPLKSPPAFGGPRE